MTAQALVVTLLVLVLPSRAHALHCGGGAAFLESEIGEWCVASEERALAPEELAGAERVALDRASGPATRAIAAHVAAEQHLRAGRWEEAERFFSLALRQQPRDGDSLRAGRAVARLRRGARGPAGRDAERVIATVCDRWRIADDVAFDHLSACRRAILVATELATRDETRARLRERWRRFAREWPIAEDDDAREYALAQCVVRAAPPCLETAEPPDPGRALWAMWQACVAASADASGECLCAEIARQPPAEMAIDEGGYRGFAGIHDNRYTDFVIEVDAHGAVLACTFERD